MADEDAHEATISALCDRLGVARHAFERAAMARIADLEDILDLRDAATRSLCIAVHGQEIEGKTIYDLVHDVARAMPSSQ